MKKKRKSHLDFMTNAEYNEYFSLVNERDNGNVKKGSERHMALNGRIQLIGNRAMQRRSYEEKRS